MATELKFKLTNESKINFFGVKLFRIEATVDIESCGVKKGDKGGWVESETISNGNARVSGNAWVYGNAEVYGDARVSGDARVYGNARLLAKLAYKKGYFVGGDDSDKPTFAEITDKTGSGFWKHQYVIGDYEISEIEDEEISKPADKVPSELSFTVDDAGLENTPNVVILNGVRYRKSEELEES